jgi:hypothetical protein
MTKTNHNDPDPGAKNLPQIAAAKKPHETDQHEPTTSNHAMPLIVSWSFPGHVPHVCGTLCRYGFPTPDHCDLTPYDEDDLTSPTPVPPAALCKQLRHLLHTASMFRAQARLTKIKTNIHFPTTFDPNPTE